MVWNERYIDIDENGMVICAKNTPTKNSIDTEGMTVPEEPTDAIYALYYNKEQGLHYVKVADFGETENETPTTDPIMEKLEAIESKIRTNEDLQTFYDDIVKEVGL